MSFLTVPILYAETHYRFPFFISFLLKKEPEILFDAPHRLDPGQDIPVLLFFKDAHRYPVTLKSVKLAITGSSLVQKTVHFDEINLNIDKKVFWKIFYITPPETGWLEIQPIAVCEIKGREFEVGVDNFRFSSKAPLKVFTSDEPLPCEKGWLYGDIHTHSIYSSDHVEYGAPIQCAVELASASGLSWFAATDHSYDLDDCKDDFTRNNPDLPLWKKLNDDISLINSHFTVIRGEEISCGTGHGKNAHLICLGNKSFIEGWGDSAEKWLVTQPQLSISEVLERIMKDNALGIAAHPLEKVPFLQRFLLRRGKWTHADLKSDGLAGFQLLNGKRDSGFYNGRKHWVQLLLSGKKLYIYGGSDAHGNFNRLRQIGLPFVSIRETHDQIFGGSRTCLYSIDCDTENIINALRHGRCFISDGPFLDCYITSENSTAYMGNHIHSTNPVLHITAISSKEFGAFSSIHVFHGTVGASQEKETIHSGSSSYEVRLEQPLEGIGYVRVEAVTGQDRFAITNPVWFETA